jgi:thiamine pyrophosphate-dependent acetolactate synthase large subunit-like protein
MPAREAWLSNLKEYGRNHPCDNFSIREGCHPADLLSTLVRYGLPVKILLLDHRSNKKTEDSPTKNELCFQQLAKAYGVPSVQLFRLDEDLDATLQRVLRCQGPALLHARIDPHCAPRHMWPVIRL